MIDIITFERVMTGGTTIFCWQLYSGSALNQLSTDSQPATEREPKVAQITEINGGQIRAQLLTIGDDPIRQVTRKT